MIDFGTRATQSVFGREFVCGIVFYSCDFEFFVFAETVMIYVFRRNFQMGCENGLTTFKLVYTIEKTRTAYKGIKKARHVSTGL